MNKIITKQLWSASDIATPEYVVLDPSLQYTHVAQTLGDTFIVKPSREGSSLGIHIVHNDNEFVSAVQEAQQHQGQLMAEKWIAGKEYTVAIVNDQALPVIRLKTNNEFYDFEAKYQSNDTQYLLPCGLDTGTEAQLQAEAYRAFVATGAQGWGRVDVMIDQQGQSWFLEVNTVPGMTDHSLVPMAANHSGIDFNHLVLDILNTSFLERG
jgi:D-alanine-D-alanine ligase